MYIYQIFIYKGNTHYSFPLHRRNLFGGNGHFFPELYPATHTFNGANDRSDRQLFESAIRYGTYSFLQKFGAFRSNTQLTRLTRSVRVV